mmetsp:Transcript_111944/g.289273  ORF Transcript_111944/g.289273 Transcript_111944/m.289273 type:complete len:110 (+) Transcript_111944:316-645(+)
MLNPSLSQCLMPTRRLRVLPRPCRGCSWCVIRQSVRPLSWEGATDSGLCNREAFMRTQIKERDLPSLAAALRSRHFEALRCLHFVYHTCKHDNFGMFTPGLALCKLISS